jgi:DNA-binding NtrC family response regulator/HAMP domain-containing protein
VRLEFDEGAPLVARAPRRLVAPVLLDTAERAGEPMRELVVRNRLLSGVLVVDACFGETEGREWQPLPLAFVARAGVPLDVWHDRPASHILTVPRQGSATVRPVPVAGHRLWLALGGEGAYPATPFGADVAVVRVVYAQGRPGPELRIVNGRDLESRLLSYGRIARAPDTIALRWEDSVRRPELFTLHSLEIDPTRPVEQLEITDLGVLEQLRVAAVTVGHRIAEAPPRSSGLRLEDGDLLVVRDEVRTAWRDLGFAVRSPAGTMRSVGPPHHVRAQYELLFGETERGALEVRMPHSSAWAAVTRHRSLVFGVAALLLTFAAVVAGAALLYRARHLRVKMLAALAAATVAPLLFLVVSLTQVLNDAAESDLKETTLTDLHHMGERLAAAKSRARELAASARDTLELVPPNEPEVLRQHMDRSRAEIEAQGAFLHLPDLDAEGPSGLGNVSFFDALSRPGLYYSPWDGLVALGLARTAAQSRCLVGLPAPRLLGAPQDEVTAVLCGPRGDPLAATGGVVRELETAAALRRHRERLDRLTRTGEPLYEARTTLQGQEVATAHALLKDGGKVVGLLGVYRSRAATENRKAAVLRTLLLSTLAALLLVVLAGGTLVERVTDRLQRVTHAAREIARGHLGSRAPVESQDEVGRLAASFNTMADALDHRVQQLTDLQRGLQELTVALDRHAVAQAAADLLARATGARRVEVVALEPATDRLEPLHRKGGEGAPLGPRLPATGPAREAVDAQRPLAREGALFLPLLAADRTVGLAICSPVTAAPETFLDLSGRQIGIALENARLYHAAVTDELTGLYTRPFFVRRLKEEVDRAAATDRPLSLLRVVIADYGAIARRHGAGAAAKVTAESAAAIERVLPRRNILACGEAGELLALLVESDAAAARAHLDRIGAALRSHEFETGPTFTYRSVTYPRDGAAADILLDSLFEVTETWEETATETGPLLRVPPDLELVPSRSPTMRAALEVVARVAPTNATVLLSGETGTGKEVLADLIQANSNRRDQPYVKVNCAAIPETLVETELFGHERGAFTGADRRRVGRFERAHRGTLFLDEVGDLPLPTQVKLLRALQERSIHRVGSSQPLDVDVRILAATNRDLGAAVRRGTFREDLYHRVHVIELRVPPLRERREDIPELINGFRQEFNLRHGLQIEALAPDALDALYRHLWPGNVRELRNIVERSMLLAAGPVVERQHVALPDDWPAPDGKTVTIEGLTPRQERVLTYARERGGVTNGEVVEAERISARTALRELQKLVDRGLLVRVGRRRGAVYRPT